MTDNPIFQRLVEQGNPTGEVVSVDRFLIKIKGLEGIPVGALILFGNGQRGLIREITADHILAFNLDKEDIPIGTLAVLENPVLSIGVGESLIGRVVSALGEPLDEKGPLQLDELYPVFKEAPGVIERKELTDQLVSGVTMVDSLFPLVMGQRMAVLGDAKSGKTTFLTQLAINQKQAGTVVVYAMIGKRKDDIDMLINRLKDTGAIDNTIVVIANIFDSLAQSYLAPYTACAMAEHLWKQGRNVVVIYDDLSSHAKVYRELSLLSGANPGRDSYPGDMFYAHSSLLERAGRLASNGATLNAFPVITTPGDDIAAYLPTNIMSITDGQIIFDLESFRQGIRPAVNAGLSVSRVGGKGQTGREKKVTSTVFKKLADYRQAAEFSHFGSDMTEESKADLELGKRIYDVFKQPPELVHSIAEQVLMLETVLKTEGKIRINVDSMKQQAAQLAAGISGDEGYEAAVQALLKENSIDQPPPAEGEASENPPAEAPAAEPAVTEEVAQ